MNKLKERFENKIWVTSVQLDPFSNVLSREPFRRFIVNLSQIGFSVTDINTSGKGIKTDSLHTASFLERECGITAIPHITPRDSLLEKTLSDVLSAYVFGGVTRVLVIQGDPRTYQTVGHSCACCPAPKTRPEKGVYETDSLGLIRALNTLREERGLDNLMIGCAFSQPSGSEEFLKKELQHLSQKIEAGADFAMTQPIFYHLQWRKELRLLQDAIKKPFLVGLWPFFDQRTKEKIARGDIKGVHLPDTVREALTTSQSSWFELQTEWFAEMTCIMQEEKIKGAYIVTPARKDQDDEFIEFLIEARKRGARIS